MKTTIKLLVAFPVIVCLAMALLLKIAQEYKHAGVVSTTGQEVSHAGRIPAFSIITIKGRAFTAQKSEATETEKETASNEASAKGHASVVPMAYGLLHKGFAWGR
jgi:hypothetical protein